MPPLLTPVQARGARAFIAVVLAATLAACARLLAPPDIDRAQRLAEAGELQRAARVYVRLAEDAAPSRRASYHLSAARLLLRAGQTGEAERLLERVDTRDLDPVLQTREALLLTELELARQRFAEAIERAPEASPQLPDALRREVHRLRARAYAQAGRAAASVRERIALHPLLETEAARDENRRLTWHTLKTLPREGLRSLREGPSVPGLEGWVQLAEIARTPPVYTEQFQRTVAQWRQRYPDHPGRALIPALETQYEQMVYRPERIALMLPLSGSLSGPSAAVREGFLAAYYQGLSGPRRPEIRVYDLGESPAQTVWSRYRQAVEAGADLVVGPLSKEAVRVLATADQLEVPVLALNAVDSETAAPDALYQFGLLPEDDARQAAEWGWFQGYTRALMIVPYGHWGERVATAFRERFQEIGGRVLERQDYDPQASDFSGPIRRVLNLDASRDRYRALQRKLSRELKFEPRRRQDAEMVFLAAFPRQARLIRPQLRFYRASSLPVIATSHVYTGRIDRDADRDMDGLTFCDMPWTVRVEETEPQLRRALANERAAAFDKRVRLYALGIDAYNVIPYLQHLRRDNYRRYSGVTGRLSMDEQRRVHRSLVCASFERGAPQPARLATPRVSDNGDR